MNTKHINGKHVRENSQEIPLHLTLKSRATAAVTAGCLALSLCPALAFAAPGAMESPQQSFGVPHEQQRSQGWQASDDGQATERNRGFNPGPAPDGGSPNDTPSGWRPEGEGDPAERQPGDAPGERQPENAPGGWQPEGGQEPVDVQGSEGQLSEPSRPNERQTGADQPNDAQSGAAPENPDQAQGLAPNDQSHEGAEPNELGPQSVPESTAFDETTRSNVDAERRFR